MVAWIAPVDDQPLDWDDEDPGDTDESPTVPCPSCGRAIYDDADRCPYCGDWVVPLASHARVPVWARWVGAVVIAAMLTGICARLIWFW